MLDTTSNTIRFNRDDLQLDYLVKLRNGDLRVVRQVGHNTKVLVGSQGQWNYLSEWELDMSRTTRNCRSCGFQIPEGKSADYDIVDVYGLLGTTAHYNKIIDDKASIEHRKLLWKRHTAVKMTVAQISKKLGYEVEIVAE